MLLAVAVHHHYQVSSAGLTRWKGGGFGMFATVDSMGTRFIRLEVVTDEGERLAALPPIRELRALDRARYLPQDPSIVATVADLARQRWIRLEETISTGVIVGRPRHAVRLATERDPPGGPRVAVRRVRLELFTLAYVPGTRRLEAQRLRLVEARAEP
jgi:hypothetical protein